MQVDNTVKHVTIARQPSYTKALKDGVTVAHQTSYTKSLKDGEVENALLHEEHNRLLRALHESIERESDLLRQLRRMKEAVVSAGIKLQASIKVIHEDQDTIKSLRKDALDAKKKAFSEIKRADGAAELVHALRLEVSALKRQLKSIKDESAAADEGLLLGSFSSNPTKRADIEVEQMFQRSLSSRQRSPPRTPSSIISTTTSAFQPSQAFTPFQEWKMQKYLWTPDTPAASEFHDSVAVEALAAMSLQDAVDRRGERTTPVFMRPIQSSASKTRPRLTSAEPTTPSRRKLPSVPVSATAATILALSQENSALLLRKTLPTMKATESVMKRMREVEAKMSKLLAEVPPATATRVTIKEDIVGETESREKELCGDERVSGSSNSSSLFNSRSSVFV